MSSVAAEEGLEAVAIRVSTHGVGPHGAMRVLGLLRRSRRGMIGLGILGFFAAASLLAPWLASQNPSAPSALSNHILSGPSWAHPFGTDENGKDVLSELLYGGRVSIGVGLVAAAISTTIGTLLGVLGGFLGGIVDRMVTIVDDWFLVIPFLPIAILVTTLLGTRAGSIPFGEAGVVAIVIGCFGWAGTTRIVRSEVLSLRQRAYVDRSRVLGGSAPHTMRHHILPNVMPLVFANAVLFVSAAILAETTLAFIGLGDPTRPSWGDMLSNAFSNDALSSSSVLYFIAPGICVTAVVMGFALLGYALESLVDPTVEDDGRH